MKKTVLINSEISSVISKMGHTDYICIGDMGLPIPNGVQRIDVAISKGSPSLEQVLKNVLSEMCVEQILIANEASKTFEDLCKDSIKEAQEKEALIKKCSHEEFKKYCANAKAIIRTGEASPYYNIILYSGVTF